MERNEKQREYKNNYIFLDQCYPSLTMKLTSIMHFIIHIPVFILPQVRTPSGTARTHRFATKTVELPAQEGERVTISLAAPSNVYREMGPLRLSARSPGFDPGEPMCLTNHTSGQVSQLLRAPVKDGGSFFLNPFVLFPTLALLATGDAASVIIDPSLPRLISVAVVASLAVGSAMNRVLLPELCKVIFSLPLSKSFDIN